MRKEPTTERQAAILKSYYPRNDWLSAAPVSQTPRGLSFFSSASWTIEFLARWAELRQRGSAGSDAKGLIIDLLKHRLRHVPGPIKDLSFHAAAEEPGLVRPAATGTVGYKESS